MTTLAPTLARLSAPNPCIQGLGPRPNKVMIIGEAPGEQEAKLGIPFVGLTGKLLDQLLAEAGWNTGAIYKTNVFWTRPINNDLKTIFLPQSEWKAQFEQQAKNNTKDALSGASNANAGVAAIPVYRIDNKNYLLPPAFNSELERLHKEIEECKPNIIIALGNTALWSLTGRGNISSLRGTVLMSSQLSVPRKLLPTFHPAAIFRQWDLRPIVVADLIKAKREAEFPELRRPQRLVTVNPSLTDLEVFWTQLQSCPPKALAVDVETSRGQITEIGFARSSSEALVVPFIKGLGNHYWETPGAEATALRYVKGILQLDIPKIFQNGLYDLQYIWKTWRFAPRNCLHDTMIKHHALFPEVQKGLGFLGSLYTDEPAWKFMRKGKETEGKRDDE